MVLVSKRLNHITLSLVVESQVSASIQRKNLQYVATTADLSAPGSTIRGSASRHGISTIDDTKFKEPPISLGIRTSLLLFAGEES